MRSLFVLSLALLLGTNLMAEDLDTELHLRLAKEANGEAWALIEKKKLNVEEKERLIKSAFASLYHWEKIGKPVNIQRGEWLISRAYVTTGNAPLALHHASRCSDLTKINAVEMKDFDFAYSLEALARAYAISGNLELAKKNFALALEKGSLIEDEKDRNLFINDLESGVWGKFVPYSTH